jgi:hypothetical protein
MAALAVLSAVMPMPAVAQNGGWTAFRTVFEPAALGVDVTVMIPPGFDASPQALPGVLKQFVRVYGEEERLAYVSVLVTPTEFFPPETRPTRLFRDSQGGWIAALAEPAMEMLAKSLRGYAGSRVHYYRSYPAVDVTVRQNPANGLHATWIESDVRLVMYGDESVKLECGDISSGPGGFHAATSAAVCRPFFDSLSFGR